MPVSNFAAKLSISIERDLMDQDMVVLGADSSGIQKLSRQVNETTGKIPVELSSLAEARRVLTESVTDTLIVDFAREIGAKTIVKGLRAISDFEYETEMNQLNRQQAPDVESLYMMASPQFSFISSSGIKELAIFGGTIDELVTPKVAARLKEELAR